MTSLKRLREIRGLASSAPAPEQLDIDGGRRLISDVTDAVRNYTGSDFLSAHDSTLALLLDSSFDLWCWPDDAAICMTRGFIDAVEFIACNFMLPIVAKRLEAHVQSSGATPRDDLVLFRRSLMRLQTAHLTLHLTGELGLPSLLRHLPSRLRLSAIDVVNLTLAYALMHEQAHIEAHRCPQLLDEWRLTVSTADLEGLAPDKVEEHFADCWALEQVPVDRRGEIFKPVLLFFLNQWLVDLLVHTADGTHPHTLARLERLACRDLGADGGAIRTLATSFADSQAAFYQRFESMPLAERYQDHVEACREIVEADRGATYESAAVSVCAEFAARLGADERASDARE